MDFPSEKMTHFKRKLPSGHTETNRVKPSKAQKMMDHLVTLLEYASQDIERVQHEPGSRFSKLVEACGSKKGLNSRLYRTDLIRSLRLG